MAAPTDYQIRTSKIGTIGEEEAARVLRERGHKVEFSKNQLDSSKDLIMDDTYKLEVKTQVLFYNVDSFTINETQYKKCMSVDGLIFVQTPHHTISHETDGAIFAYDSDFLHNHIKIVEKMVWDHQKKKSRKVYMIPRDKTKVIGYVSGTALQRLRELTPTLYKSPKPVVGMPPTVAGIFIKPSHSAPSIIPGTIQNVTVNNSGHGYANTNLQIVPSKRTMDDFSIELKALNDKFKNSLHREDIDTDVEYVKQFGILVDKYLKKQVDNF